MAPPGEVWEFEAGTFALFTTPPPLGVQRKHASRSLAVAATAFCFARYVFKLILFQNNLWPKLWLILGFLSHPQNVYPSYLTPPLNLQHSNLSMSQLNMMAHHHNGGGLRISPQSMQQQHLAQQGMPVTSSASAISMMPQTSSATMSPQHSAMQQSPSHNLALRSPSPDKKSADLNVDSPEDSHLCKDTAAINMTISSQPGTTDIRTNSIAALRIKAKEHLENINKNLTMV